jgi:hypothetical protein
LIGVVALFFLVPGCGYHRILSDQGGQSTLSIPYFCKDQTGRLTEAVIRSCSQSSAFRYVSSKEGRWILRGEVCSDVMEDVGYRYDREPSGERVHRLIATEGNRSVKIKVSLIDSVSQKVVLAPFIIEGNSDFDFIDPNSPADVVFTDLEGREKEVIVFSLGQLDSRFSAESNAAEAAYKMIGEKVFWELDRRFLSRN